MANAIEGYSRPNTGQTIQIKNQTKSTPVSKPQTVTKNSSNASGAVYTASTFEEATKNKSTYTAKATYTNPVLAKKQSTVIQVAQSNKEAVKTTPNALSAAKNFFGGIVDAGVSTAKSLGNVVIHPVQTAKDIGNAIAHPVQTAEAIKGKVVELADDFKKGDADVKAHMIGRAVGEIGLAIVGTKGIDKAAKGLKTIQAVKVTTNTAKVADVAEETAKVARAVSTAVKEAEKVADEVVVVNKIAPKNVVLDIVGDKIKGVDNAKKYTPVEFEGTVKVDGEIRDVSRRVYQRNDIDYGYFDSNTGLTNLERMKQGKPPIGSDGKPIQLHHLTQKEKGSMVEIMEVTHQEYYSKLHGLVGDGESFRNNPILEKQYNNFRSKYWKWRAEQLNQ